MAGPGAYDFEPEYSNEEFTSMSDLDVSVEFEVEVVDSGSVERSVSSWCKCGRCRLIPTERECLCCQDLQALDSLIISSTNCNTLDNVDFNAVCLNHAVLQASYAALRSQRHGDSIDALPPQLSNRYTSSFGKIKV